MEGEVSPEHVRCDGPEDDGSCKRPGTSPLAAQTGSIGEPPPKTVHSTRARRWETVDTLSRQLDAGIKTAHNATEASAHCISSALMLCMCLGICDYGSAVLNELACTSRASEHRGRRSTNRCFPMLS